jgi:acetyl-CoA C-acetyltransferase
MPDAYIFDAVRTPRGRGRPDGALHEVPALRLAAGVLAAIRDRSDLDTREIEDVILGCVTAVGEQGGEIARSAALYVAGGVESMSRVPMGSDGVSIAVDPALAIPSHFVPQGIAADLIATYYGITREQADAYAAESQRRAALAWEDGRFNRSVVPVRDMNGVKILDTDEHMRPETTAETLAALKPSFKEIGETMPGFDAVARMRYPTLERIEHIHHAGNASGIVDGAAAVLLGTREIGDKLGLFPRARVRATARIGTDPTMMLTGPVPVTEKVLAAAGMTLDDIDLIEINEAFASVVLRFIQAFDVSPEKVNVNGGAIAMGHPLGATGAMLLGTALDELERTGKQTALVTLCVASGMGAATIIERV